MRSVIIAAVAACLVLPVQAATITIKTIDSGSLVMVTGEFDYGDEVAFKDRTVQLSNAVVVLRSRGGNAVAGIGIGRAIRAKRFTTLLVDACSSACAIAWLGGTRRLMAANAQIGFHEVFYSDTRQPSGSGNARLGAYLNEIGLSERAVQWIADKVPDDVNLLTKQVADAIGIDVEIYHDVVPTAVNVPPAQPPAQPFYAPGAPSYTAALALGAANGAVTVFAWLNASDRPSARIAALNGCRNSDWGTVESRNACQIVTEFHAMCVSVASDGHAYGW
jgi:hypothetical protein